MKRVASLDFLRGLAAFSVAIPHYLTLNVADSALADAIAITSVEVFFVLSGFVLAPQILTMIIGGPAGYPIQKLWLARDESHDCEDHQRHE